jgi:hypothetical protein
MHCPVCRAPLALPNAAAVQCRRCRADLSLLVALEKQRARALAAAYGNAARGEWRQVLAHARWAHVLRKDDESYRLLAAGYLMQGDFARAWQCWQTAPGPPAAPGQLFPGGASPSLL